MTKLAAIVLAASFFANTPVAASAQAVEVDAQPEHFLQVAEDAIKPQSAADAPSAVPASTFETEQLSLSASPVAEPGTWALLALGILGLGLARRRLAASRNGD